MFRPFELFVGFRYLRARRASHFVSFISLISMLGIDASVVEDVIVTHYSRPGDPDAQELFYELNNTPNRRVLKITPTQTIGFDGDKMAAATRAASEGRTAT